MPSRTSFSAPVMAAHRPLHVFRWQGNGKEWTFFAVGLVTLALVLTFTAPPLIPPFSFSSRRPDSLAELILLSNAQQKGAGRWESNVLLSFPVCLDGSSPGYHWQRGWGSGLRNWVVHLEGGGWCGTVESCALRKQKAIGSSYHMERKLSFQGILSNERSKNPDFFNWNRVMIRYCDGASFAGNVISKDQNKTELFFRGQLIWEEIMAELLLKGLKNAEQALLTGCSAGGLATFIHCNDFHVLLPKATKVKCFADGGYFLDSKDLSGARTIRSFYRDVVHLQDLQKILPKDCVSSKEPAQCFFPQEIIKSVQIPFFILNSAYDWWQIHNVLVPKEVDIDLHWLRCKKNIRDCNHEQIEILNGFRETLIHALGDFQRKKGTGLFINSCSAHCQTMDSSRWHSPPKQKINNMTIAQAVGDWYFDRADVKIIDCPYPCNPTCDHRGLLKKHIAKET